MTWPEPGLVAQQRLVISDPAGAVGGLDRVALIQQTVSQLRRPS